MTDCPWCDKDLGCRNAGDEATCDFKTLKKEPHAIKARMDEEQQKVLAIISIKYDKIEDLLKAKAEMNDRLHGIRIMKEVYEGEFNMFYAPTNQLEFTHKLINFVTNAKTLERKLKQGSKVKGDSDGEI